MVAKKSIFSIPIYVCSHDDFISRISCEKDKFDAEQRKTNAFKKFGIIQKFPKTYPTWKYNRIIAWIDIYINGKTLKADYWLINSKRITFNVSKNHFKYIDKIADVSTTHLINNEEIIADIKNFFRDCQNGKYIKKFKKYYIDTYQFYEWLDFVDIKGLIQHIDSRSTEA